MPHTKEMTTQTLPCEAQVQVPERVPILNKVLVEKATETEVIEQTNREKVE